MFYRWIVLFYIFVCLIGIITDHGCRGDDDSKESITKTQTEITPPDQDSNNNVQVNEQLMTDTSLGNTPLADDVLQTSDPEVYNIKEQQSINDNLPSVDILIDELVGTPPVNEVDKDSEINHMDDLGQKATSLNSDTSGENQATKTENDVENPDDLELKTEISDSSGEIDTVTNGVKLLTGVELSDASIFNTDNVVDVDGITDNTLFDSDRISHDNIIDRNSDEEIASSDNENTIKIGTGAHANTLLLTGDSDSIEKDEDDDGSSNIGRRTRKPYLERHDENEDSYSNSGDISDNSRDDISSESHEKPSTSCNDMDVVFVVDSSDDVEFVEFQSIQQTVDKLATILITENNNVRIGVIVYGSRITDVIPLSNNATEITKSVLTMVPSTGLNKPYLGILAGRGAFSRSGSSDVSKVIVFIASGLQQFAKPAAQQSRLAKRDGIRVMTIGYGDGAVEVDLEHIASRNSMVYKYESATDVLDNADKVSSYICKASAYKGSGDEDESSGSSDSSESQENSRSDETDDFSNSSDNKRDESDNSDDESNDDSTSSDTKGNRDDSDDSENRNDESSDSGDINSSDDSDADHKKSPQEMCANSKMVHGVGYKRHSTDCDKFIECYYDEFGKTRASIQRCPFGEFWDHTNVACVESEKANCPNDPCKAPALFNRPTSHGCRSYWGCQNGQSVIMCCPDNMSYQPRKGCVPDSKCSSKCPPDDGPEYGTCDKRPLFGKPYLYKQWIESGHWVEMLCAPGTLFDETDCGCTMRTTFISTLGVRARASERCRPEVYLPFCEGFKDWSGKNTLVQNEYDKVLVVDGKAYFNGESSLFIPRFSGATYGDTIYIKMRYKPDFTNDDDENEFEVTYNDDDNDEQNYEIRRKRSVIQRKRRDTDLFKNNEETLTPDEKPAAMMQPILPLDSIGFQPIDESKQHILDEQNTITNGNILPVVPQGEVLVQDDGLNLGQTAILQGKGFGQDDGSNLGDQEFVEIKAPDDNVMMDNIQTTDDMNKDGDNALVNSVTVNNNIIDKQSSGDTTGLNSRNRHKDSDSLDSDSSEGYFSFFETSHFDDQNGGNLHYDRNYETDGNNVQGSISNKQENGESESYFKNWFNVNGNELKDGAKNELLSNSQDKVDDSGEHYFKGWFANSNKDTIDDKDSDSNEGKENIEDNSKPSDDTTINQGTVVQESPGNTVNSVLVGTDSTMEQEEQDSVNPKFSNNRKYKTLNVKSNRKDTHNIYGEYDSDDDNFEEDVDIYRWESESQDSGTPLGWNDWNDDKTSYTKNRNDEMNENSDTSNEDITSGSQSSRRNTRTGDDTSDSDEKGSKNTDNSNQSSENKNTNGDSNDDSNGSNGDDADSNGDSNDDSNGSNGDDADSNGDSNDDSNGSNGDDADSNGEYIRGGSSDSTNSDQSDSDESANNSNDWMTIVSGSSDSESEGESSHYLITDTTGKLNFETNMRNYENRDDIPHSYFMHTNADIKKERIKFFNEIQKERNDFYNEMEMEKEEKFNELKISRENADDQSYMALVSNGDCNRYSKSMCLEDPSLSIGTDADSTTCTAYASESKRTRIKLQKDEKSDDGWRTVLLTIHDGVFRVSDEHSTDFEPVSGPVKTTFAGIYIGKGTGMKNFKGYIDEVYIYLCQPEDLDNFKSLDLPAQTDNSDDSCDYINKNVVKHYNSYNSDESDSPILWWVR